MYSVKEIYATLQGEGAQTGRAAVFLRFAGCNLWTGLERDRESAVCQFCDTDFIGADGPGGGKFADANALADAVALAWDAMVSDAGEESLPSPCPSPHGRGGEHGSRQRPLSDGERDRLSGTRSSFNGESRDRRRLPKIQPYVVCTGGEPLLQLDPQLIDALHRRNFEIAIETNGTKAAPPGLDWICVSPKAAAALVLTSGSELKLVYPQPLARPEQFEHLDFRHFFLQPMDGPDQSANIAAAARYCLSHPQWRLSLQTHKLIGLP